MAWFTSPAAWRAIGKGVVSKGWGGTKAVGRVGRKAAVLGTAGAVGMGVNPFLGAGLGKLLGGMGGGGGRLTAGGGITGGADTGTVGPGAGRDTSIVAGMRPHSAMPQINVGTLKPKADFRSLLTYTAKTSQATYLTTLRNNRELIYIQKMLQGPTAARAKELRMESAKGRAPIIVVAGGGGEGGGKGGAGLGALLPFAGLAGLLAGAAVAGSGAGGGPTTTATTTPALGAGDVLFKGGQRHMGSRYQDYQRWLRGEEARLKGEAKVNKLRTDYERALKNARAGRLADRLRLWKLQRALAAAEAAHLKHLLRDALIDKANKFNEGEAERFAEEARRWRERMNRLRIAAAGAADPVRTGNTFEEYQRNTARTRGSVTTGNEMVRYSEAVEAARIRDAAARGSVRTGDTFENFRRNTLRTTAGYGGDAGREMGYDAARERAHIRSLGGGGADMGYDAARERARIRATGAVSTGNMFRNYPGDRFNPPGARSIGGRGDATWEAQSARARLKAIDAERIRVINQLKAAGAGAQAAGYQRWLAHLNQMRMELTTRIGLQGGDFARSGYTVSESVVDAQRANLDAVRKIIMAKKPPMIGGEYTSGRYSGARATSVGMPGSGGIIGVLSHQVSAAAAADLRMSSSGRSFKAGGYTEGGVGAGRGALSGADVYARSAARGRAAVVTKRYNASLKALDFAIDAKIRGGRMPGGGWSYPYGMNPSPKVLEKALTPREFIRWRAVQNQIAMELKGVKPSWLYRLGTGTERLFAKYGRVGGAVFLAAISGVIVWAAIVAYMNQVGAKSEKAIRMMGLTGWGYPGIMVEEGGGVPNKLGLDSGSVKTEGTPKYQLAAAMAGLGSGLLGGFAFGVLFAAFGQMAIPFPGTGILFGLIGGIVGWIAGEKLGRLIFDVIVNRAERKKRIEKKTAAYAGAMGNIAEVYGRHSLESAQGGIGTNVGGMTGDFGGEVRHHGFFPKKGSPGFDASRGNYLSGAAASTSTKEQVIISPSGAKNAGGLFTFNFKGAKDWVSGWFSKPTTTATTTPSSTVKETINYVGPTLQKGAVSPKLLYDYLRTKSVGILKVDHIHAIGMLTNIEAESSYKTGAIGDNGHSGGLFQWNGSRFRKMKKFVGPNWAAKSSYKKQIDFAFSAEDEGPTTLKKYLEIEFLTIKEAVVWFYVHWERARNKNMISSQDARAGRSSHYTALLQAFAPGTGPDFSHVQGLGQQIRYDAFGRASGGQSQHLGRNVHGWTSIPNATVPPSALNMPGGGAGQTIINNITNSSDAGTQQLALTVDANPYNQFGGPLAPLSGQGDYDTSLGFA